LLVARRGKFLLEFADGFRVSTVRGTFGRHKPSNRRIGGR
jgi:hypothetical protein